VRVKRLISLVALVTLAVSTRGFGQTIRGAAEAAPHALYVEWVKDYPAPPGRKVLCESGEYQEILRRFESDSIDFAAFDLPLTTPQLAAKGLVQFPTAIGGVVPIVNIPGVVPGALRLSGRVIAGIFLGTIKAWNDPALKALNPSLPLPEIPIQPAHPKEPSGTTFVFTTYLSNESHEWQTRVGAGLAVGWPAGDERKDSRAVVAYVQATAGAIGYVDYSYAAERGVAKPKLQNRAGEFVSPTVVSFQAAAANAPWDSTPAFALLLVDQGGLASWPLTAPTFAVLPLQPRRPERILDALRFFRWALRKAGSATTDSGYVPLPPAVASLVEGAWKRQIKGPEGRPVWEE
jgi:phosphate transport system substrate-binding protein